MPYRKFRPLKQWEKMHSFVLRHAYWARLNRKRPLFKAPDWVQERGITLHDPNDPDFPRPCAPPGPDLRLDHPIFKVPSVKDHRLYKPTPVCMFNGTEPFSEGVSQALILTNSLGQRRLPTSITESDQVPSWLIDYSKWWQQEGAGLIEYEGERELPVYPSLPWSDDDPITQNVERLQSLLARGVRQAHIHDPTLEMLPRRHDNLLFWYNHQRVFGTPENRKYDIMLNDIYRRCLTLNQSHSQFKTLRHFRNSKVSVLRDSQDDDQPSIYFETWPLLTCVQGMPLPPVADHQQVQATAARPLPSNIEPVSPYVDLIRNHHLYDTAPCYPRIHSDDGDGGYELYTTDPVLPQMYLHTMFTSVCVTDEQHQKYPWSDSAITATAITRCYAGALAVAHKRFPNQRSGALPKPVVVQLVQMCRGSLDLVVFQLNTFDVHSPTGVKNMCWFEQSVDYHHYTTYWLDTPPHTIRPHIDAFAKVFAMLVNSDDSLKNSNID